MGTRYRSTSGSYCDMPITVQTCPAARKACTLHWGESMIAVIAGGTSTWLTSSEKLVRPRRSAMTTVIALAGAVVSNPIPKNTTCRSGFCWASRTASSGE